MNATKRDELDAKLREMIELNRKAAVLRNQRKIQCGSGNIIRRRKGEQDKRISIQAKDGICEPYLKPSNEAIFRENSEKGKIKESAIFSCSFQYSFSFII